MKLCFKKHGWQLKTAVGFKGSKTVLILRLAKKGTLRRVVPVDYRN